MKDLGIKLSRVGITAPDSKGAMYLVKAIIVHDSGKKNSVFLNIPPVANKKQLKKVVATPTHFLLLIGETYYLFDEGGNLLSSFDSDMGKVVAIDSKHIIAVKDKEVVYYTHQLTIDHKVAIAPDGGMEIDLEEPIRIWDYEKQKH